MTFDDMCGVVADCRYQDYAFKVAKDGRGEIYLQGLYEEPDTVSGVTDVQYTRRWLLSPEMTKSEIVQTVFKLVLTSAEHRVREWFKYRGYAVYGPHYDVDALHELCANGRFAQR